MTLWNASLSRLPLRGLAPGEVTQDQRFDASAKSPWTAEVSGFNVHAGVTVYAGNRPPSVWSGCRSWKAE